MNEESRGKKRCRWCMEDMDIDAKVCPHCRRKQKFGFVAWDFKKVDFSTVRWKKIGKLVVAVFILILVTGMVLDLQDKKATVSYLKNQNEALQGRLTKIEEEMNDPYRDTYFKSYDPSALYVGSSYSQCDYNGSNTIIFDDLEVESEQGGQDKLLAKFVCKHQDNSTPYWYFNMLQSMYVLVDGKRIDFSVESTDYSTSACVDYGDSNIVAAYFYVDKDAKKVEIIYHSNFGGSESNAVFRVK